MFDSFCVAWRERLGGKTLRGAAQCPCTIIARITDSALQKLVRGFRDSHRSSRAISEIRLVRPCAVSSLGRCHCMALVDTGHLEPDRLGPAIPVPRAYGCAHARGRFADPHNGHAGVVRARARAQEMVQEFQISQRPVMPAVAEKPPPGFQKAAELVLSVP